MGNWFNLIQNLPVETRNLPTIILSTPKKKLLLIVSNDSIYETTL